MAVYDVTDEIRSELETLRREHSANEAQQTALKIAGSGLPTPLETRTSEGREMRGLLRGGNVGEIFHVAIHGGTTTGQTAELQQHYGLEQRMVPLAMLTQDWAGLDKDLETRAVTPAPSNTWQASFLTSGPTRLLRL